MKVQRVEDEHGSHIEPPLNQHASPLEKLQWHAAVLEADTGVSVAVTASGHGFALRGSNWGASPVGFIECWSYITGMSAGAREMQAGATHAQIDLEDYDCPPQVWCDLCGTEVLSPIGDLAAATRAWGAHWRECPGDRS